MYRSLLTGHWSRFFGGAIACTALCTALSAGAAEFAFAVFGDTPYTADEEANFPDLIAEMNREGLAFVIHLGDFKSANSACTDDIYLERRRWFELSRQPFVYVPGDNDWLDCTRALGDPRNPRERLQKLRALFFGTNVGLGQHPLDVARQSGLARQHHYPEHLRWSHRGLVFVTLNVPGPSNNLRDPKEHEQRSAAIADWLAESFALARERNVQAVVVLMHASPWAPSGRARRGFERFLAQLARETQRFRNPVLLVHGDEHRFVLDQPLRSPEGSAPIQNFTRIEVFGSPEMNWVRVKVIEKPGRIRWDVTPGS
ncbi:MAG: metallophosphoesterase [Betaproteobacteria bacterium]|nr:metallophosphoesterase [Betaproteobacteria bacterium]